MHPIHTVTEILAIKTAPPQSFLPTPSVSTSQKRSTKHTQKRPTKHAFTTYHGTTTSPLSTSGLDRAGTLPLSASASTVAVLAETQQLSIRVYALTRDFIYN